MSSHIRESKQFQFFKKQNITIYIVTLSIDLTGNKTNSKRRKI